jgi:hypothetical protein
MALDTYANFQTSIASWLARDDLTAFIPDFITIFEAAACRRLRVRLEETTTTLTPTSGMATLPSDYLGHRRVTWLGSPTRELTYVVPTTFSSDYPTQPGGTPSEFTIEGSSLKVMPSSDTNIELLYYQKTAAVSSALNWLFTRHPDAYLFGTLCEANAFNKGQAFEAASIWKTRRDEVFEEIQKVEFNERTGMSMRLVGITP